MSVDVRQVLLGDLLPATDSLGVALCHHKALLSLHAFDQRHAAVREILLHVRLVVRAGGLVQQVDAPHVRLAALDSHDTTHTAHVRRGDRRIRILQAHHIGHLIDQRIVAAGDDQHTHDLLQRPQQLDLHRLARLVPFAVLRHADNAIRLDKRSDHTCAAVERHGRHLAAHAAYARAHKFLVLER